MLVAVMVAVSAPVVNYSEVGVGLKAVALGDVFEYGEYPQSLVTDSELVAILDTLNATNNDVEYNGNKYRKYSGGYYLYEPITWVVFSTNSESVYVMSANVLDSRPFNEGGYWTSKNWETCSLRVWLNSSFYNLAFSENEKSSILTTTISTPPHPNYTSIVTKDTTDKIFIPSLGEMQSLSDNLSRAANLTDYSLKVAMNCKSEPLNGMYNTTSKAGVYWLRTMHRNTQEACVVFEGGSIWATLNDKKSFGIHDDRVGVRPAFCIDIDEYKEHQSEPISGTITGASNVNKIAVNGTWYYYDPTIFGLAEAIDKFAIGESIYCKLSYGKIVACSKSEISSGAIASINTGNVSAVKYSFDTKEYDFKNIDLGINITNSIVSRYYGTINTEYIAGFDVEFDRVVISSSEKDLLCFKSGLFKKNEMEIELAASVVLRAGNVYYLTDEIQMMVNDDYEWDDNETKKEVAINVHVFNGTDLVTSGTSKITFVNQSAVDDIKKTAEAEKESQIAANLLNNTTSIIQNAFLSEIFTANELKNIQNALECKLALCALPKSVYEKAGIAEKIMNKLMGRMGVSRDWFGTTYTADISLEVNVDTKKYGQLEILFNAPVTFYSFGSDNPFAGANLHGISYEITGGKGKKNVSEEYIKADTIGMLVYANVQNFAASVEKVALAQLESAYNLGYGDDLNKVGEFLMGETFTKILSKTSAKSYSHLTFSIMTFPSKQIGFHCPVDVYVYDAEGVLCTSVVDNEIIETCDDITVEVMGDEKYLTIYDGDYSIEVIATANDEMCITIDEYCNESEKIRTTVFDDIVLRPGDRFNTDIDEIYIDGTYEIEKNRNEMVLPDADDVLVHHIIPVEIVDENATCTERGMYHIECLTCKNVVSSANVIKPLGHNLSEPVKVFNPTCTETGKEKRECLNCDYQETNILDAIAHNEDTIIPAVPATYKNTGLTEGKKCSGCGTIMVPQEITEILPHTCANHDYNHNGKCDICTETLEAVKNCDCMCHKSGFMSLVYAFVNLFWRLFGTNKACECGVHHW